MTKGFKDRNQSSTARHKLKRLSARSCIDIEITTALANVTWDYDPDFNGEAIGWVKNTEQPQALRTQLLRIAEFLNLPIDFTLDYNRASKELIQVHLDKSVHRIWENFDTAVETCNYALLSEFSSFYYLCGIDHTGVKTLRWKKTPLVLMDIARWLFIKLFRGGAIERHDLGYLWCDLTIQLPYHPVKGKGTPSWIEPLLKEFESLPPHNGLNDLRNRCKGLIPGNKLFKQSVLESLSYADVLRVNGYRVTDLFIPEWKDLSNQHFFSNEWTFPLRFWPKNGGTLNRKAVVL